MANDDECVLLWAIPTWRAWADFEQAQSSDQAVRAARRRLSAMARTWTRMVLVDAPLSPFRTGRQPSRLDRAGGPDG
jgi:hypothetical protein